MTALELIQYLRVSVNVQTEQTDGEKDPNVLSLTDEQLRLYLQVVITRDFPKYSVDNLPQSAVYPVILLAKKELYFALATSTAPLYDLSADSNNSIKRDQMFRHYMDLVKAVDDEYNQYNEDGGAGNNALTSFDVLLADRSATKRNYEKGVIPDPFIVIDNVGVTFVEFHWDVVLSKFRQYNVYVSTSKILDSHNPSNPIDSGASPVATIKDVHHKSIRVTGLLPNTRYFVVVSATEMSSLTGYAEATFTTNDLEITYEG